MSCNLNGQTIVNTCVPVPGATTTSATYVIDFLHYLCGNRRFCINGEYPLTATMSYQVLGTPQSVGNGSYNCEILCSGTLTYLPYGQGCSENCLKTESVWATINVPVTSAVAPTLRSGTCVVSPANVACGCCSANAVSITSSVSVVSGAE